MKYEKQHFTGERALFMTHGAEIEDSLFDDGESPLKESHDFAVRRSTFAWKYPLWYSHDFSIDDCRFETDARAGIWYSHDFTFKNIDFIGPKAFRKCYDFELENVDFKDGLETLWWNHDFRLKGIKIVRGDYFCMYSHDFTVENLDLDGKYTFDGVSNVIVKNTRLITKDCFWNSKNVTLENCYIEAEYFGWNSENITLINCEVHSHQGFCYMKNVKLVNCIIKDTDLAFEYCENIDAEIKGYVESIKNPISGKIRVEAVGEIIRDDPNLDHSKTEIIVG